MTAEMEILVKLLAATDATWVPIRRFLPHRASSTWQARQRFLSAGVPHAHAGSDDAGHKTSERQLKSLASDGLVVVRGQTRALSAKLTDEGEALARSTVGIHSLWDAWNAVGRVAELTRPPQPNRPRRARPLLTDTWISEERLTGEKWGSDGSERAFLILESRLLPGLIRGWVESNADIHGRVYYKLTAAGRQALSRKAPADPDDDVDAEAATLYHSRMKEVLHHLGTDTGGRDIGYLPLPVSIDGVAA